MKSQKEMQQKIIKKNKRWGTAALNTFYFGQFHKIWNSLKIRIKKHQELKLLILVITNVFKRFTYAE